MSIVTYPNYFFESLECPECGFELMVNAEEEEECHCGAIFTVEVIAHIKRERREYDPSTE